MKFQSTDAQSLVSFPYARVEREASAPALRVVDPATNVEITSPVTVAEWDETRQVVLELFDFIKQGLNFDMMAEQDGAPAELAQLSTVYAPPHARMYVGKVDGGIVATTGMRLNSPDVAELKRVYVRPEARGYRLAPRMLERAIDDARRMGARSIWLETAEQIMHTAVRMYHEHGFRNVGRYTVDGVTGLVMEKSLIDPEAPVPSLAEIQALSGFTPDDNTEGGQT